MFYFTRNNRKIKKRSIYSILLILLFKFQLNYWGVTPEPLQGVEISNFLVEDVGDDTSKIEQDPVALLITLFAQEGCLSF